MQSSILWLKGRPPEPGEEFHVLDRDGVEIVPPDGWDAWRVSLNRILSQMGMECHDPERVVLAYANTRECFVCERRAACRIGLFCPDHPALWPGPPLVPGKQRAFIYGVCRSCFFLFPKKQLTRRVEGKILQRTQAEETVH